MFIFRKTPAGCIRPKSNLLAGLFSTVNKKSNDDRDAKTACPVVSEEVSE